MDVWQIDWFGKWSYPVVLLPYYGLLICLVWKYRVIWSFRNWWHFIISSVFAMLLLGVTFEWIADIFYVWSFPPGRDLCRIQVPIFGWFTGHTIPVSEFLWIVGVVPLFYYLYFWATLVFHDVIYVYDEGTGKFYKKEERWVGFHDETRILKRPKGKKGREFETPLLVRKPGFAARVSKKFSDTAFSRS
jgi:hypothetical protein